MYGNHKYIVNDEQKKQDIEYRKKQIIRLLEENSDAGAVIIRSSDGRKKVVSEKAYKIICLSAVEQPKGKIEIFWEDLYNNGPWRQVIDFYITPPSKEKPSFLDRRKISKKVKTIEEIKTSENPIFDKKGKVRIKVFPISHREVGEDLPNRVRGDDESRQITPEEIHCFEYECTPRELAKAGFDYKEFEWEEIIEKKSEDRENFIKNVNVDTPSGNDKGSKDTPSEMGEQGMGEQDEGTSR